jgi:hypothetical protein
VEPENELVIALNTLRAEMRGLTSKLINREIQHADDIDRDYVRQKFGQWINTLNDLLTDWRYDL